MPQPATAPAQKRRQKPQAPKNPQQKTKKKGLLTGLVNFGQVDIPMLTILLLLLMFGLVMLFSASYPSGLLRFGNSYDYIGDQLRFAFIGLAGMVAASLVDYRILRKFAWPLAVVSLVLLVVVLFISDKNNAHRWIWLNSARTRGFQPSEIAKLAVILVFAKMITANQSRIKTFKYGFMPLVAVLGVFCLLIVVEPHVSCTLLVLGIGLSMMLAGGVQWRWFALGAVTVGVVAYLLATRFQSLLPEYVMNRIEIWQDPFNAKNSYQTIQGLIAVGSGGLTGRGIGQSVQKFLYLPEVYNDYIYAVVCEELGMVGGVAVMLLFLALLGRGIFIALRAKDKFGSMLVIGITVQISLQAFLHIAVNLNAIPATGISLPFFSYGGTSLCMLLGQMGIVLSVSRKANLSIRRKNQTPEPGDVGAAEAASALSAGAEAPAESRREVG
ncbi:FtsW/RodA/SpoVE family cell cycle protein [Ruminococcaceae bacterium OttesenSCG-928-D13]|nr:FtsW/RodA/SpoVE family cell cycle protein [Ruminococcaceae bacterium OttesenSCG-928-D13]